MGFFRRKKLFGFSPLEPACHEPVYRLVQVRVSRVDGRKECGHGHVQHLGEEEQLVVWRDVASRYSSWWNQF